MHKKAKKVGLDLEKYNKIKEQIYKIEHDLRRLRDPLQVRISFNTLLSLSLYFAIENFDRKKIGLLLLFI